MSLQIGSCYCDRYQVHSSPLFCSIAEVISVALVGPVHIPVVKLLIYLSIIETSWAALVIPSAA